MGQITSNFGHNLEGNGPEIKIVFSSDPLQLEFVGIAAKKIQETAKKSTGLETILAVFYLHSVTIRRLIEKFEEKKEVSISENQASQRERGYEMGLL